MKIAIMQPYFFPYVGYFQLVASVDKFIVFDDVNYINRGWINRNNILVGGKAVLVTVPLQDASQNKKIHEIDTAIDQKVVEKLMKTILMNYKKASCFNEVYELLQQIFIKASGSIAEFNLFQLSSICNYLSIETQIIPSSRLYSNDQLKGEERIIDICRKEGADEYINPIGGVELYERDKFEMNGIKLHFIKSLLVEYPQFNHPFVPWLSIIDVLMFNSKKDVLILLQKYQLQ